MSDIPVSAKEWNAISKEEMAKIEEGLRQMGALSADDRLVPDATVTPMADPMWNPIKDLCKAACDVVAAKAAAWCTANTAGVGLVACLAAAEAARRECRKRC